MLADLESTDTVAVQESCQLNHCRDGLSSGLVQSAWPVEALNQYGSPALLTCCVHDLVEQGTAA
jgi:hypothetical protein